MADPGPAIQEQRAAIDPSRGAAKQRKLKWKEERELEGMEAAILNAENEVARLEALFSSPDFYTEHRAELGTFEQQLCAARDEVARLYSRWAELSEIGAASLQ